MSSEEATTLINKLSLTPPPPSSSAAANNDTISLLTSDGVTFEVEEKAATVSQLLKRIVEDHCAGNVIPLPNVSADILKIIISYCKRHADSAAAKDEDREELKSFDMEKLFEVIRAANYLEIKELLDLACQTVADSIQHMMPEQVRDLFGVENDYTEEEEQALRSENPWAFQI